MLPDFLTGMSQGLPDNGEISIFEWDVEMRHHIVRTGEMLTRRKAPESECPRHERWICNFDQYFGSAAMHIRPLPRPPPRLWLISLSIFRIRRSFATATWLTGRFEEGRVVGAVLPGEPRSGTRSRQAENHCQEIYSEKKLTIRCDKLPVFRGRMRVIQAVRFF